MPKPTLLHYDDEGNGYTSDQVLQAVDAMHADEDGQGSLGGVALDNTGDVSPTQNAQAAQEGTPAAPAADPNADVDALVHQATAGGAAPSRETNPAHFGSFLHDNVFGGLDGKYITGKRPMTAFDYATDVLGAYGGENIGKRNAEIRKNNKTDQLGALKAEHLGQQVKTGRAQEQQAMAGSNQKHAQTTKILDELISDTFENYDADTWDKRISHLAKDNGVPLDPATQTMVTRAMETMHNAGATSVSEVLANKDKYAPEVYNRVRHLTALMSKHIDESEAKQAETSQRNAAAGAAGKPKNVTPTSERHAAALDQLTKELGRTPNDAEVHDRTTKMQGKEQGTIALERSKATNRSEMESNLASFERYFSDPQYDKAVGDVLYKTPNVGGQIVKGEIGRAQRAVSRRTFGDKMNAGDDSAQYLASVVQTIIPRIRADAMGTKGLRINMAELELLDQGAKALATGDMTADRAAAFKRRALSFIKQTRGAMAQADKDTEGGDEGNGAGVTKKGTKWKVVQ